MIRWKIRYGIGAEGGNSSVVFIYVQVRKILDFSRIKYINQANCYMVYLEQICLKLILTSSKNVFII